MGKLICVGLGPGDPELMSVRADRLVRNASHIAFFRKIGRKGQARQIVEGMLRNDVKEFPMEYPVTTELDFNGKPYKDLMRKFYDDWSAQLQELAIQNDVIILCEGDPFFYGSYMHLYTRLIGKIDQEIVPAITGMSACWTATQEPICWGDDIVSVLPGTLDEQKLVDNINNADAIVIMKTGRNLPKIKRALEISGRLEDAWLVEKGSMKDERVIKLSQTTNDDCPYFAIVLVHGQGRRP